MMFVSSGSWGSGDWDRSQRRTQKAQLRASTVSYVSSPWEWCRSQGLCVQGTVSPNGGVSVFARTGPPAGSLCRTTPISRIRLPGQPASPAVLGTCRTTATWRRPGGLISQPELHADVEAAGVGKTVLGPNPLSDLGVSLHGLCHSRAPGLPLPLLPAAPREQGEERCELWPTSHNGSCRDLRWGQSPTRVRLALSTTVGPSQPDNHVRVPV